MNYSVVKNRFHVIEPYIRGKSVLDIGCVDSRPGGQKKYMKTGLHIFLKEHASELLGIDLDEAGINQMREEGYNVIAANAENVNLGKQFDCIVAGEIIEHLSNPGLFLDNMKRHLKENGFLIITTSNAFSIVNFFRILKKNRIKVHDEHTAWYCPKTIQQLLSRYYFKTENIFFANKSKWYLKKYFYKLKYQFPKIISHLRPYFSSVIIVIAKNVNKKLNDSFPTNK